MRGRLLRLRVASPPRKDHGMMPRLGRDTGAHSFLRSQISRPRKRSRWMTTSQCHEHSSICRKWPPAASVFSAIRVARFRHLRALHCESYLQRCMRTVVGAGSKSGSSMGPSSSVAERQATRVRLASLYLRVFSGRALCPHGRCRELPRNLGVFRPSSALLFRPP